MAIKRHTLDIFRGSNLETESDGKEYQGSDLGALEAIGDQFLQEIFMQTSSPILVIYYCNMSD